MWGIDWSRPASADKTTRVQRSASNEDAVLSQRLMSWVATSCADDAVKRSFVQTGVRESPQQVPPVSPMLACGAGRPVGDDHRPGHADLDPRRPEVRPRLHAHRRVGRGDADDSVERVAPFQAGRRVRRRAPRIALRGVEPVNARGPYANLSPDEAYDTFADNVMALIETKQKNTSLDGLAS